MFKCGDGRRVAAAALCAIVTLALSAPTSLARDVPWVAGVTDSSVYVCLEDDDDATSATVDYGPTTGYGSSASTENKQATDYGYTVYNMKLTTLSPNTLYNYRVTRGAWQSANYTFRTAPQAGTAARWGFAADCRSGSTTTSYDTTKHNNMAGLIAGQNPNMMVYGGDLCYGPTWPYWNQQWFMSPYDAPKTNQINLNATTPFVNAPGNHEDWNNLTKAFTQSADGDPDYFSFDYGDAHIVIINNEISDSPGSAQSNWVAADLAASTAKWKVVAFHQPAYSYGSHGGNADMQSMTTNIFEPNGVDLVLSGHNHFYQHNLVNGIHHMTIGTFGVPPGTPGSSEDYTIHSESAYCFGIIDTTADTLTLTTYREDGSVIETIVIPEPSAMILLALGAMAALRRRRR